jgi:hypothetical protein
LTGINLNDTQKGDMVIISPFLLPKFRVYHFSPAFCSALTSRFPAYFSNFSRENWGFILSTSETEKAPLPVWSRQTETIPTNSPEILQWKTTK